MTEAALQRLMREARGRSGYWTRSGIVWAIQRAYSMGRRGHAIRR